MVGPSISPIKSKGQQPIISSDESDDELSGLRELHTRTQTGIIALVNYNALARGIEVREAHSAIAEFTCTNFSVEKETIAYIWQV